MPDVVTPSAFSPKAAVAPVAKPVTPVTPTAPVAEAKPVDAPEVVKLREELAMAKRHGDLTAARQKQAFAKEKEGLGPKLTRLGELEKLQSQAKINKSAYLKSLYGDDWYDQIIQEKLNGGAPTGEVVASEVARVREEMKAEFDRRDSESKAAVEESRKAAETEARNGLSLSAQSFWEASGKDYPAIKADPAYFASVAAKHIEDEYNRTSTRDENGKLLRPGKVLTMKEVAEKWEESVVSHSAEVVAAQKYADRFKPKPPQSVAPAERRTLSNALTGSTPGQRPPPATVEEKRARAEAAYLAARKPQP